MSDNVTPGQLVVIIAGALVRLFNSEQEHYTLRSQYGIVIQESYLWVDNEQELLTEVGPSYLILFSNNSKMYYVPRHSMMSPEQAKDAVVGWHDRLLK